MSHGRSRAARLQRIEELLVSSPEGYTAPELAEILEVHRTTVWRDLNELSCDVPIQQSGDRYLIDREDYISHVRLSRGESLMLYLALRRLLRRPSHISSMMALALEKLASALRSPVRSQIAETLQAMNKRGSTEDPERVHLWETLIQGWLDRITVRITYQEFRNTVLKTDEVQPYLFEPGLLSERVYLIGHSLSKDHLCTYDVERILSANLTTRRFERQEGIVVDGLLQRIWGPWYGEEKTEVRLRFRDPAVAGRVARSLWVPGQKIHELPGGGIEWSAGVPDVFELVPWIRGWGPDCEVVAPAELQEFIGRAEEDLGDVIMATSESLRGASFSEQFYSGLQTDEEGRRIRQCIQCGACSGVCPFGFVMDAPTRKMIAMLRADIFDEVLETDSAWMCVSCYACSQVCPMKIPLASQLMTRTKEELLLSGDLPGELQEALEYSQRYGNPLGESPRKRAEWARDLDFEVPIMAKHKQPVQVLWYVGDYASYHPRVQAATRAFAQVLHALNVDFGILGPEESSDGDTQRMAGERGLFEMLAEKNARALAKYEFDVILTTDPHAYNAIKNEYPRLGYSYPIQHYTEFLAEHLDELQPMLSAAIDMTVTYHDPCYLGRVNGVYDPPRELLGAIPGVELVEMSHARETSLCCGGGGGGMWLEGFQWEKANVRLSEWRVREAIEASGAEPGRFPPPGAKKPRQRRDEKEEKEKSTAKILAVACPYEAPRFEDAAKTVPSGGHLLVKDIAELLVEAMEGEG